MSKQYLKVEPRYAFGYMDVKGQSVFWTSMCEIFFQSPFCLLCFYAYHRNKSWRRPLEIIVSVLQVAGVWWFYVPEAVCSGDLRGGVAVAVVASDEELTPRCRPAASSTLARDGLPTSTGRGIPLTTWCSSGPLTSLSELARRICRKN